jgi:hypothetical protein
MPDSAEWKRVMKGRLGPEFYRPSLLRNKNLLLDAVFSSLVVVISVAVVVGFWGRMRIVSDIWFATVIVWLVRIWRDVIRDYQLLHRLYREGSISDLEPGSALEAALSVAANMTHWNLSTLVHCDYRAGALCRSDAREGVDNREGHKDKDTHQFARPAEEDIRPRRRQNQLGAFGDCTSTSARWKHSGKPTRWPRATMAHLGSMVSRSSGEPILRSHIADCAVQSHRVVVIHIELNQAASIFQRQRGQGPDALPFERLMPFPFDCG